MQKLMIGILMSMLVIAAPTRATTLFPKDRVCPIGGEKYQSFEIGSTSYYGMRLDLQRGGVGASLPYVECPNGFIVFKDESEFTSDEIAKLTPVVASSEYQAARKSEMPAMRVVMLRRALGEDSVALRHWLFKAAFEAEQQQLEAMRLKYLAGAADAYAAYLRGHTAHDDDWWFSAVRHADLLRQLSRFDEVSAAIKEIRTAHSSENPILMKIVDQIEKKTAAHDSNPEPYVDRTD